MIKHFNQFIREFVEGDNYIDAKMQELKDLINGATEGQNIIYEWENKNDHQLVVSFSTNDLSIKYDFDIDDLYLTKTAGENIDFSTSVESIDEGLDIIEKDIYSILDISENKKYNLLLERAKDELFLLLEDNLYASSDFISKLKSIEKSGGKSGEIAKYIFNLIEDEVWLVDKYSKQNYLDLTDKDDMLSFIQPNKMPEKWDEDSNPGLPYELPSRNEIKIGKVIKNLCDARNFQISAKELEDFVNIFKASSVDGTKQFKLVSGKDIAKYYDIDKYYTKSGSLGGSCMADRKKSTFNIYAKNEKVNLLILIDADDKVHGRALVWKLSKSPCAAKYFMDRVYTNSDSDFYKFKHFAEEKGYLHKKFNNAFVEENINFYYKGAEVSGVCVTKIDKGDFDHYPFMDTMCFLDKDYETLSNVPTKKCYFLQTVYGGKERCDVCHGTLYEEDYHDEEKKTICSECCEGLETLINKKIVKKSDYFPK